MAIVKVYNKARNVTYVYESVSYWDKELKQPRSHRKLIGRIDPVTGYVGPTGKRAKACTVTPLHSDTDYKASVCLFIRNFAVPFDNKQAERDVRNVKTKTKVSGCFRTESGAQDYLDIMSYISTGRKHGVSAYEALTAAFAGKAEIVLR